MTAMEILGVEWKGDELLSVSQVVGSEHVRLQQGHQSPQ